ncbi:MAG: hypothetical protein ACFFB5_13930 [Promethearchaeota archaeon]
MSDLVTDVLLIALGAFLGYLFPKFVAWKDEQRIELLENYIDLIKHCYGELRFIGLSIGKIIHQQEVNPIKKDYVLINLEEAWVSNLKKVYSQFRHELSYYHNTDFMNSYERIIKNINYNVEAKTYIIRRNPLLELPYDEETWWISTVYIPDLKFLIKETEDMHTQLTTTIIRLRNRKSSIVRTFLFYLPFRKMPKVVKIYE